MIDHDGLYHQLYAHPAMMADLLREFVSEAWIEDFELHRLEPVKTKFQLPGLPKRTSDIIWRVPTRSGSEVYLLVLLEFQSAAGSCHDAPECRERSEWGPVSRDGYARQFAGGSNHVTDSYGGLERSETTGMAAGRAPGRTPGRGADRGAEGRSDHAPAASPTAIRAVARVGVREGRICGSDHVGEMG
ncbi:MAG: Rpn family recombination-promoting nuclease/putative transposase [Magnetococcales bacterium]|nr:Rpn family recombination-promoting nuclease/putative transposase [Magnetococcales bacterium]